ncbi:hypothetical protein O7626_40500 [Micromonospora sp. WMMD1102]|uniref:hypothetical protein n=1 Tax=Micromonospora sp. WMMD1102 TaxID=3016105 RepID=UPI002415532E|nr:hypothetical protein [Micromonospora sp. WMMD1102]MDG4792098.1 hypothetical protein [Micromonospora sp. WMMD1102]
MTATCQVADPVVKLSCGVAESGGFRCEVTGPHNKHRIGGHTIAHALAGNGYACSAINPGAAAAGRAPLVRNVVDGPGL